ncbi:MAG: DUF3284 domain-containing protein [Erysipelotrichaceae bacterium]
MEIVETLNVNQKEFFDYIEEALKQDLKNQRLDTMVTENMTYQKRMRRNDKDKHEEMMDVYIEKFDRKENYQCRFALNNIEYTIGYKINKSTLDTIEVVYKEEYQRKNKLPKLLNFILPHKVVKNSKSRMRATLKMIEKNIIANRKGNDE